tara:strand:- start:976 stop:1980 length:1005 start_codon:yes stop_codon:yes gene_type:complete
MAENLGQIDVVVKSDDQKMQLPALDSGFGAGAKDATWLGSDRPGSARAAAAGGGRIADAAAATAGVARFAGVAAAATIALAAFAAAIGVIAVVVKVVAKAIAVLKKWDAEVQRLINKFTLLNGTAALAGAIQKVGEFQRSFREAKALAPMLLQMSKARESFLNIKSAVSSAFNTIKLTVLEAFFRVVTDIVGPFIDAMGGLEGLTRAARICTLAILKFASLGLKVIGFIGKAVSFIPGVGGMALGGISDLIRQVGEQLDEAVDAIKKQTQEQITREEMKEVVNANALTLGHLEHMTGGVWRHSTQIPLKAATGREINPRQWAAREAAKKQRRNP